MVKFGAGPTPGKSAIGKSEAATSVDPALDGQPWEARAAIALAACVGAVFVWWAWKQGAFFGTVFLPGAVILYALLILLLIAAPFNRRVSGPARVAVLCLVALGLWTLLSIAWTSNHDTAVQDAQRTMLYAAVFGLGLWTSNFARSRPLLPLAAVAAAGIAIGIVITITLAGGHDVNRLFHDDATFRFPIGYRNAEAAFLLICFWPLVSLSAVGELPWQLRALMMGGATMLLELIVLAQSRGSLPAAVLALIVFIVLSPRRLRVATVLALTALPVLLALPTLLDVFQYGHRDSGLIPLMRDSARAVVLTSLGSIVLAALCLRGIEARLDLGRERVQLISRVAAILAIATVVVGGTIFVVERGGPIDFVDQRVSEFELGTSPDLQRQGTRFGVNVATNRGDFWRVALHEGADHPLRGGGAGSFQVQYLLDRRPGVDTPEDPHSIELLMFSELGIVGLLLFAAFVVAAVWAGLRSRRSGPSAVLVAGCLAAGAGWLMQSSYDWFWPYPALTAPVMFLLGSAAAPALREQARGRATRARWSIAAAFALLVALALPLFLSQRYASQAYAAYPQDPTSALDDLDRAGDLNPYDTRPLLAKGVILSRLGRHSEAAASFREAVDRQPDGYAAHYYLAGELARSDPAAARAEAAEALRLNPQDPLTRGRARRLGAIQDPKRRP